MKTHLYPLTCDVCGCEGMATPRAFSGIWSKDSFISHADPRICADNLKRKAQQQKKKDDTEPNTPNP